MRPSGPADPVSKWQEHCATICSQYSRVGFGWINFPGLPAVRAMKSGLQYAPSGEAGWNLAKFVAARSDVFYTSAMGTARYITRPMLDAS